jgi:hypothetical protein
MINSCQVSPTYQRVVTAHTYIPYWRPLIPQKIFNKYHKLGMNAPQNHMSVPRNAYNTRRGTTAMESVPSVSFTTLQKFSSSSVTLYLLTTAIIDTLDSTQYALPY